MNEAAYHAILQRLGVEPPASGSAENAAGSDSELARRVVAFRRQLEEWTASGRPGVPLLALPEAPEPRPGQCVSCGEAIPEEQWRCELCRQAIALVLNLPEADWGGPA